MTRGTSVALALGSVLASLALATPARAQQFPTSDPAYTAPEPSLAPQEGFGAPGTIAITSDFDIDLRKISQSNGISATEIHVAPSLLMFLAPNLGVGGIFDFQHDSVEVGDFSRSTLALGPLLAYNINISPRASVLPTLGLLYRWGKVSESVGGGRMSTTGYDISMLVRIPVLFHAFTHVFVGATPFAEFDLVAKSEGNDVAKTRTLGVTLDLGAWF